MAMDRPKHPAEIIRNNRMFAAEQVMKLPLSELGEADRIELMTSIADFVGGGPSIPEQTQAGFTVE